MNTTLQIRIDKKTKDRAQKALKNMGLDLTSGVKYYLSRVASEESLNFVEDLHQSVTQSEKEFAQGKGKKLRSLKDLM